MEKLIIAGREFSSRLFLGTGKFNDNGLMAQAIDASETEMVTVAMKRIELQDSQDDLLPDSIETLKATEQLVKLGFIVLPYCQADPTLCKHLEEAGAATVMPLGAPIGTNKGLQTRDFLRIIIEQANVPVVVDAGIGAPSHAAEAMEMGASACLVNTAIAVAGNPVEMGIAFKEAVIAGRRAFEAGLGATSDGMIAEASSPLTSFLD